MRFMQNLLIVFLCIFSQIGPLQAYASSNGHIIESLNEDWLFYEQQLLIHPDDQKGSKLVDLPIEFEAITGEISTYGTFIKQITIPQHYVGDVLALELPYVYGALKIYANGQLLTEIGQVGTNEQAHETDLKPALLPVTFDQQQVELTIQLSSFNHIRGGFSGGIKLGEWHEMSDHYHLERLIVSFVSSIVLIVGLLALVIGILGKGEKMLLTFGLFSIGVAVRAIFSVPFVFHELPFDISYVWATKLEYISTNVVFLLYVWFIYLLFKELASKIIIYGSVAILGVLAFISLLTEPVIFQTLFFHTSYLMMAFVIYSVVIIIVALKRKIQMAKPLFLGVLFVFTGLIFDLLSGMGIINFPPMSLFTIAANVVIILFFIGNRYANQLVEVRKLNNDLLEMNKTLDVKVQQRTKELSEANSRLAQLATRDGLTGIYNRLTFNDWLTQDYKQAVSEGHMLSLLMMDVDEFKKYNDRYGHVQGDQLLKSITELIQRNLPQDVKFARYGGEEFVFLLPNYSKERAWQIAESLRLLVKGANFEHLGRAEGIVTISIGGAELTMDKVYQNEVALVELADERLYISKTNGRNRVTFEYGI
ncbi:diguanylate cyclase [Solibacillus sp.]|uniref:sensor domain-containing diguanylate cyclase n=1 Tax=Solibacillus sp. TaxID=1909654 RepID=UPI0033162B96